MAPGCGKMGMGTVRNEGSTRRGTEWDWEPSPAQPSKAKHRLKSCWLHLQKPTHLLESSRNRSVLVCSEKACREQKGFRKVTQVSASSKH